MRKVTVIMLYSFMMALGYTRIMSPSSYTRSRRTYKKTVYMATSVMSPSSSKQDMKKRTPITVLSGFLGSGKTSFLQHALTNEKGTKIGLLINDMASVNVDSKLIKKTSSGFSGVDTLELQNGCVCCTLAEDMFVSVGKLIQLAEEKNSRYDHIIVECSGIAEPRKIRDLFQAAEDYGEELLEKVSLDTLVTIVDASVFLKLFGTDASIQSHSSLAISESDPSAPQMDDATGMRKVTDLLLEQVECADTVLINKIDLLSHPSSIELVTKVVKSMNPKAKVLSCVRGVVNPADVVGSAKGAGAVSQGILDEHRQLINAVETGRGLGAGHGEEGHVCDSACQEHGHDQEHAHVGDHEHSNDATCTHPSHSHDHDHTTCNDPTHDHSHNHDHATCNDPTHDHSHNHDHASEATTAETRFGITSFVYKRRRPFHPSRFTMFLQSLGKLSMQGLSDYAVADEAIAPVGKEMASSVEESSAQLLRASTLEKAKRSLLRSKGFVWMATSAAGAYYMSHAGQYLELVVLGRWWADIKEEEWPESSNEEILVDFDKDGRHGDRRQELVFIGQFSDNQVKDGNSQKALEEVLDSCLLTDAEMGLYEEAAVNGDKALRTVFFKNF